MQFFILGRGNIKKSFTKMGSKKIRPHKIDFKGGQKVLMIFYTSKIKRRVLRGIFEGIYATVREMI